jgi:MHS family proline/betaine transporter-like MFS transporter
MGFGVWIRYSTPESFLFIMNNTNTQATKRWSIIADSFKFIKNNPTQCLSISALTLMGTCLSFIYYIFIPINLTINRGFSQNEVFSINVISLLLIVILIPFFGKLSDFINRIYLLKIICFFILLLALPFFWAAAYGRFEHVFIMSLLISVPSACFFSIYPVIITESFPSKIRCTTASLIYQIVVSVEMGTLPLITNYLIKLTKVFYSPGYLLIIATLIGFLGLFFIKQIDNQDEKDRNAGFVTE